MVMNRSTLYNFISCDNLNFTLMWNNQIICGIIRFFKFNISICSLRYIFYSHAEFLLSILFHFFISYRWKCQWQLDEWTWNCDEFSMLHCSLCPISVFSTVRVRPRDLIVLSKGSMAVFHSLQGTARDPVLCVAQNSSVCDRVQKAVNATLQRDSNDGGNRLKV